MTIAKLGYQIYTTKFTMSQKTNWAIALHVTPNCPTDSPPEIIDWALDNPNTDVWYATDTHTPTQVGDWTVKVTFYDATGSKCQDQTKFKATSFFVVDEVPLGTIVTLAIPFGFLSFVAIKKKRTTKTK